LRLDNVILVFRRGWWLLVLATLLAGVTGYVLAAQSPRVYEASARLLVGPFHADLDVQRAAGQLTLTYAEIVRSQRVVLATIDDLSLGISPLSLSESIQSRPNNATRVLTLSIEGRDPERAAEIVNTLAANLIDFAASEDPRPEGQLTVIDEAQPRDTPVAPRPAFIGAAAAAAGFLVSVALTAAFEYLDNGVRTVGRLARLAGVPVLASVRPRRRLFGLRPPEALVDPGSEQGFLMDLLSAKVEFAHGSASVVRSIVLISIDRRGGTGWVTLNLASSLTLRGRRVAVIDVDPAGEVSHLALTVPPIPGLDAMRRSAEELERISSEHAREVLESMAVTHDVAVVHTPSVQLAPNSIVWASAAGAVVLVVRDSDPAPVVASLAETLAVIGAPVVGSVLVQGSRVRPSRVYHLPDHEAPEKRVQAQG
jgi:capsular polysaccharide biosynthesis protein/Mrp family chromosome partitioning ATPase